jgi:hypothetical protein
MAAKEYLHEFVHNYIKNLDAIQQKIVSIDKGEGDVDFIITYQEKKKAVIAEPFLKPGELDGILSRLEKFKKDFSTDLFVFNTKENFDEVVSHWKLVSKFDKQFKIYFVNPFSGLETKWVVFPYTHDMLSEDFKAGLKALYATVESFTQQQYEKLISQESK